MSPHPPPATQHLGPRCCKLLEFLFLAAQILASFLRCAAPRAAGRLVYPTANLSVTQHGHLVTLQLKLLCVVKSSRSWVSVNAELLYARGKRVVCVCEEK